MYFISSKESWHVTFVKISKDRVEEHLRKVIVMEGLNELYLSEVEFTYCSEYESVRSYRSFLRKQKEFDDFKDILQVSYECTSNGMHFLQRHNNLGRHVWVRKMESLVN